MEFLKEITRRAVRCYYTVTRAIDNYKATRGDQGTCRGAADIIEELEEPGDRDQDLEQHLLEPQEQYLSDRLNSVEREHRRRVEQARYSSTGKSEFEHTSQEQEWAETFGNQ